MKKNKQVWGKQAKYWKQVFYEKKDNIILKWLLKKAKKTDKILDQGCGIGQYTLTAYKLGFKNIIGVDFSEKLLKTAKTNAGKLGYKASFVKGDIRKLPFKNNEFDIIISAGIIEHVPESNKAISEIARVLKKNGYLLLHVPHKISVFTLFKKIQQFLGLWKLGYEKSFSIFEISGMLHNNGFEVLNLEINEFKPRKHKFLGKIIQIIDKPLYKLGLGGHHLHLLCQKSS